MVFTSACARAYECRIDGYEVSYEIEMEECWHEACTSMDRLLAHLGEWAQVISPLEEITDEGSGMVTFLLAPYA